MSTFKSRGLGGKTQGPKTVKGQPAGHCIPRAWKQAPSWPVVGLDGQRRTVYPALPWVTSRPSGELGGQTCACECKGMQAGETGLVQGFSCTC